MMPTPVVYWSDEIDPFVSMPAEDQSTTVKIFYVTDRKAAGDMDDRRYTNGRGKSLRLGEATVRIGSKHMTWEDLHAASNSSQRRRTIPIVLTNASEYGSLAESDGEHAFAEAVNRQLARSRHKDINIYLHGANVNFERPCLVSAELFHFLSRDGVMVAFAWPSRQSVTRYFADVREAGRSAPNLTELLDFLAANTDAENINILSYSAGSRILSKGLVGLRQKYPDADAAELRRALKISNVIFAAADKDLRTFADEDLRAFYDLPRSIRIVISEQDPILRMARVIHGGSRLGSPNLGEITPEELAELVKLDKIEVINVTYTVELREYEGGFGGHGYWYQNSWVSTDILASLRWQLPADQRGLELLREGGRQWFFPADYPQRIDDLVLEKVRAAGGT
ncbi:MAG: alpha/beta hydrolase [Planctomycetota bacterium]|jgi:esterase/lipase superfamily enzyme